MSEAICDLANELLKCNDWDPCALYAAAQVDVPTCIYFDDDVPFATARELIVDISVDPCGYADVYIDDTAGLTVNLPGT